MSFSLEAAGKFRANPEANLENAVRLLDRDNPGTPATDSGTVSVAGASTITGINYTGKDGVSKFIQFFNEAQLTQKRVPYVLAAAEGGKVIQDAIHDIILLHEVDPIVSVERDGDNLTIEHTGAGTLESIVVDGSNLALSRANISSVSVLEGEVYSDEKAEELADEELATEEE